MTSHAFGAFVEIEPSSSTTERPSFPSAPQRAYSKTYPSTPELSELDNLQWGARLNGPPKSGSVPGTPTGTQTPRVMDLEMSRPVTPNAEDQDGVDAMQSFSSPPMNRFRMTSVCLINFANGLSDSAPGALIPYMEKHYDIGYAVVSLIFVTNAIGFISAAFFVDIIRGQIGRAKTLMFGQALLCIGYVMIVCTPPFPVVIISFFFLGLGMAINLALGNVFAANLHNGTKMLGFMHGSYGLGGTIGPLIATAMVTQGGLVFSRYYLLILGLAFANLFFAGWAFWHYEAESGQTLLTSLEMTASRAQSVPPPKTSREAAQERFYLMAMSFRNKVIMLGAMFIFAYQGAEVSISGWVISFLIATRNGNPASVGYVTAGFWGGITVGRFLLSHPAHKIGEKLFVYIVVVGAGVFQLLVWWVPNIIGDAVALAIVGLLLGPVYPCACLIFSRSINRSEQVSGLSLISAFGSSGGAVAPFTTGILAQAAGTFVLHPIAIGLFAVMIGCWFFLPTPRKRTE